MASVFCIHNARCPARTRAARGPATRQVPAESTRDDRTTDALELIHNSRRTQGVTDARWQTSGPASVPVHLSQICHAHLNVRPLPTLRLPPYPMSTRTHDETLLSRPTPSLSGTQWIPLRPHSAIFPVNLPVSVIKRFAKTIWCRAKATLRNLFGRGHPNTPGNSHQQRYLPPEIVGIIIARLTHDIPTLKACAATCSTWHNIAIPHLYHIAELRDSAYRRTRSVQSLHELGLLPFVKELQIRKPTHPTLWVNGICDIFVRW